MKDTNEQTKKKIHSVKSWLEKAETSYDDKSITKGKLQLLLAKAEMQHLEETDKSRDLSFLWVPFMVIAIIIAGSTMYWHQDKSLTGNGATVSEASFSHGYDGETQRANWVHQIQNVHGTPLVTEGPKALVSVSPLFSVDATKTEKDATKEEGSISTERALTNEPAHKAVVEGQSHEKVVPSVARQSASSVARTVPRERPKQTIITTEQMKETVYDAGRSLRGN